MPNNAGTPEDPPPRRVAGDAAGASTPAAQPPAARSADPAGPELDLIAMVTAHYEALYRYAYRLTGDSHEAEDLTQQTFLVARQKVDGLRDALALRGWLFTVLRNLYLKDLRRRAPHAAGSLSLALDDIPEPSDDSPIDSQLLQKALDQLPDDYRVALLMFYFEELSYREIAQSLDIPLGTVMSRLARARQHLRRELESRDRAGSLGDGEFGGGWRGKPGRRTRAAR